MYMHRVARRVQGNGTGGLSINVHHAVAGSDEFDNLSMSWDLMPAARLQYVHDFPGMYNCVSQVVYFHNPRYERRMQRREGFEAMLRGECEAIHLLPCLMQLYPDVELLYEDEAFNPHASAHPAGGARAWWVMAGKRLYLLTQGRGLLYAPNPAALLASHVDATPGR